MRDASTIKVEWQEDGSATALARVTARDATGQYTGVSGEGKWVKQADLSSITAKIFTEDGTVSTNIGSLTVSSVILDTPDTTGEIWDLDTTGYNFRYDFAATAFPDPKRYIAEFVFTLSGGGKFAVVYDGTAIGIFTT